MLLHCALFFLYKLKSQKALFIEKKIKPKRHICSHFILHVFSSTLRYAYTKSNLFSNQKPDY